MRKSSGSLPGGQNGTTDYDTGTVTISVTDANNTVHTASVNYGQGSTDSSIATALISAIGTGCTSFPVYAEPDKTYNYRVDMYSCKAGASSNYAFTSGSQSTNSAFTSASFTPSPASGNLTGGSDAGSSGTTAYSVTLGYAPDGDVTAANDNVNGNWTYGYDDFNRLIGGSCTANCPGGQSSLAYSYDYDEFGNRWHQNVTVGTGISSQVSFNANNQVVGYTYDADGDVIGDGNHTYAYDAENRLIQVDGGTTATYAYNAQGQRVEKTTAAGSVFYLYDLASHVVAEINSSGGWNRGEVYAGGKHLATYVDGTTYFDQGDWLGTERARTDATGAIADTCTGLPFGDDANCTAGGISPLYFTGKQRDTETGLDYFGARYYTSNIGRFMTPDWSAKVEPVPYAKLPDPQTLNLYTYVRDNPVTNVDADGHWPDVTFLQMFSQLRQTAASAAQSVGDVVTGVAKATVNTFTSVANNFALKDMGIPIPQMSASNSTQATTMTVTGVGIAVGLAVSGVPEAEGAEASTTEAATTTVTHFTNDAAVQAISSSGQINAGSYVTLPSQIPAGATSGQIESLLEIAPGKGANSITFDTPTSNLIVPENGAKTSGGVVQFQLQNPAPINPKKFVETPH